MQQHIAPPLPPGANAAFPHEGGIGGAAPAALLSIEEEEWLRVVGEESAMRAMRASAIRSQRVLSDAGASGSKAAVVDQSGKRTTMAFYKHGSLGNVAEGVNLIQSEIYLDRGQRGPLLNGLGSVLLPFSAGKLRLGAADAK